MKNLVAKDIMNPDCLVFVRPKEKKPEAEKKES